MPSFLGIPVTGTAFSVTSDEPGTYDSAGFEALTYTDFEACEIQDFPGFDDSWTTIEDDTLCETGSAPVKGKKTFGPVPLTIKLKKSNAAHAIMEAAEASSTAVISCKVEDVEGDKMYFTAQVMKYDPRFGNSDNYRTVNAEFQPQGVRIPVAAV